MEDISSLIWLGIAIVWFLTKLIRRGAKKVATGQKKPSQPSFAGPAAARGHAPRNRIDGPPSSGDQGSKSPPPIVPR